MWGVLAQYAQHNVGLDGIYVVFLQGQFTSKRKFAFSLEACVIEIKVSTFKLRDSKIHYF